MTLPLGSEERDHDAFETWMREARPGCALARDRRGNYIADLPRELWPAWRAGREAFRAECVVAVLQAATAASSAPAPCAPSPAGPADSGA